MSSYDMLKKINMNIFRNFILIRNEHLNKKD